MRPALVLVLYPSANPATHHAHQHRARDRPAVPHEHPHGVCRQVVLPGHVAVDVARGDGVVEAGTEEGEEDGEPRDCRHTHRRRVEAHRAADEREGQGKIKRFGVFHLDVVAQLPAGHVRDRHADRQDHQEPCLLHQDLVVRRTEERDLVRIVGVENGRQHGLHHEVRHDVDQAEGQDPHKPRVPIPQRGHDGGLLVVLPVHLGVVRRQAPEQDDRNRLAEHDVPEDRCHGQVDEGHEGLAHDVDHGEGRGEAHDGPRLCEGPKGRYHA
mmetsp:Transcript_100335/g.288294  ORF Transcript_100335/g.288294 Transcript_100335/m.288294 type:complete len:269 (-) Transcript_100335:619-1425(-)